jgi:hypothetical protein
MLKREVKSLEKIYTLNKRLLNTLVEALVIIVDFADEHNIILPYNLPQTVDEILEMLEELNTTSATPQKQHHKNQQKPNKKSLNSQL